MSNQNRKFQIEAFKYRDIKDQNYADKTWNILERAIHDIFIHNNSHLDFEDLYRHAYNMILHKFGEKLYSGLVATMTSHLNEIARSVEAAYEGLVLEELNRKWNDYNKALHMIRDMLMYMDRTYVPSTQKTPVYELGLNLWRENVIYSNQIRTRLSSTLLELVYSERVGEDVNVELIRNITKMLMDLGPSVYEQEFETPFLQGSTEFYKAESLKFIECCECGDYLKETERRLNEEIERVRHYLDPKTEKKITDVVEKEMIENHMITLIHMENSGLVNMLCDDKYEDLGRMYNLFGRVNDGLSKICEVMTSHIRETVKQLNTDPERLKDYAEFEHGFLDAKNKYDKIIKLAFSNDEFFQNACNSSFEFFGTEEEGKSQID
ncbi:cullin-3A-like [Vicia villosa]|uniref:cullin-3A-like n=1 Tax=Vicia villosa TaxID=3911 RepID=UPI00273C2F64|nr:cullin-3A-like [Vicia villosa]